MKQHKMINRESVARALMKAERYRLLNEPRQAESICRDVLEVEADNGSASHILLLTLTDQFNGKNRDLLEQAQLMCAALTDDYERAYYAGVISERWGKAKLDGGFAKDRVYELINEALGHYDMATTLAPKGNDDAILRWNTCLRLIERYDLEAHQDVARAEQLADQVQSFDDEVPMR